MTDLFSQPPPIFYESHGAENNSASEATFEENAARLNRNANVILLLMKQGKRVSGLDCINGLLYNGEKVYMTEYRKRFDEIKRAIRSGAIVGWELCEEKGPKGSKIWSLKKTSAQ